MCAIVDECRLFPVNLSRVRRIQPSNPDSPNRDVLGLAKLGDTMFVAHWNSETVVAYQISHPQSRKPDRDIEIKRFSVPVGFRSCEAYNCLYLGDANHRCVWKVSFVGSEK